MKKIFLIIPFFLFVASSAFADEIQFFNGTWEEVKREAKRQNKPIFVDFYATWCGPCIQMSRDIFTLDEVGNYYNSKFINYKIDAEKEELSLVNSINIEAYPTLVYFDPDGKIIKRHIGFAWEEVLLSLGASVAEYDDLKKAIMTGSYSREELLKFLVIAREADPDLYNQYELSDLTLEDISSPAGWNYFSSNTNDINSPEFQLAIIHSAALQNLHSDYPGVMLQVMGYYFWDVVETGNIEDLDIYKDYAFKILEGAPDVDFTREFINLSIDVEYYKVRKDIPKFVENLILMVETYYMDDEVMLKNYASLLDEMSDDPAHQAIAESWKNGDSLTQSVNAVQPLAPSSDQRDGRWTTALYASVSQKDFRKFDLFKQTINTNYLDYRLLNAAIFYLANEQRTIHKLDPLEYSSHLEAAAWHHSKSMGESNFFSHENPRDPSRKTTEDRAKLAGIKNPFIAENIAGQSRSFDGLTYLQGAELFIDQWMKSSGHRANILSEKGLSMGCGAYLKDGKWNATQKFQWFQPIVISETAAVDKLPD